MAQITVYMTSVTSSRKIQAHQNEITRILETNKIPFKQVDISVDKCLLEDMRKKAGNASALPPLLFRDDHYLGGHEELTAAVEDECLHSFLEGKE